MFKVVHFFYVHPVFIYFWWPAILVAIQYCIVCLADESVSVDTVRGALKLMEKWEVVECHTQDKIKLYYLGQHYDGEGMLSPIIDRIQQFQ
jgi:hypothetical protein